MIDDVAALTHTDHHGRIIMGSVTISSPDPSPSQAPGHPPAAFLAATSLTFLKPRFKRALRPLAARLAHAGVTANQVTVASLVGSLALGAALSVFAYRSILFGLLPAWLLVRMGLATVDGTLAIDFGQKSKLGSVLNEAGDILSEIALFLPFAFVAPFQVDRIAAVIFLTVCCELVGMAGPLLGGTRRVDGPFGKADRSIALGVIGAWLACFGSLPASASALPAIFAVLLVITIFNRWRFAAAERATVSLQCGRADR